MSATDATPSRTEAVGLAQHGPLQAVEDEPLHLTRDPHRQDARRAQQALGAAHDRRGR